MICWYLLFVYGDEIYNRHVRPRRRAPCSLIYKLPHVEYQECKDANECVICLNAFEKDETII